MFLFGLDLSQNFANFITVSLQLYGHLEKPEKMRNFLLGKFVLRLVMYFFGDKCGLEIIGSALNFSYLMLLGNLLHEPLIKSSKKSILTNPNQLCHRDSDIEPIKWLSLDRQP